MNKKINWQNVQKVLVVRLRSIGDTVLSTPSLKALRNFLPEAQIDVLLEDWVAPVLEGISAVDNILTVSKETKDRIKIAKKLRQEKYDVAFNLHGGTTATFLIRASGARHRIGYENYQYSFFYNHLLTSSADFWQREKTHSAEQQLALLGFVGIPVRDKPKTILEVSPKALASIEKKLTKKAKDSKNSSAHNLRNVKFALFHPVAAFQTKQWATENFARIAELLHNRKFQIIAVATKKEREVLEKLKMVSGVPILTFDDLTLPEITALASISRVFIGNDSGIAHIVAAIKTPSVVIFGSSNRDHWRPWTDAPNEIVYREMSCQPCAGYICKEFDKPKCIIDLSPNKVWQRVESLLDTMN